MPQGLQIWDASGTLILDTSTYVLKELAVVIAPSTTTSTQYLTTYIPPSSTIVGGTVRAADGSTAPIELPDLTIDIANSRLAYKFENTSGGNARIYTMAF